MNMSYCRFTNTGADLGDCLDAIRRGDEPLSDAEAAAGKRMFREFLTFCRDYDIIDGYDSENIEDLFDGLQKERTTEACEKGGQRPDGTA